MTIKVAILSMIRPHAGSGEGITEYVYRLSYGLKKAKGIEVECIYPLEEAKRMNVFGYAIAYAYFTSEKFKRKLLKEKYDVLHIANEELGFLAGRIRSISPQSRIVLTVHGLSRAQKGYHRGAMQNAYNILRARGGIRDAICNSDFVIYNSSLTEADAVSLFGTKHRTGGGSSVIYLGIDETFKGSISKTNKGMGKFVVGYVGSFTHLKNVMFILKTAALLKGSDFSFKVYGFGSNQEIKEMEKYKRKAALDEVNLNGMATREKIKSIYSSFDAFMFPSRYEGFGLPILEAQSMGLPVITYKEGRIPAEVNKYCLEAANESDAANMLQNLKRHGYDVNQRRMAMRYARGFSWEKAVKETISVYYKTLNAEK